MVARIAAATKRRPRPPGGGGLKWREPPGALRPMLALIGHGALVLAFAAALVQGTVPLAGAARGHGGAMALSRLAACVLALATTAAFAALLVGYVVSDFSLANVFQNSHSLKPMLYKVAGVWGNHEGSLLLWVLVLALFGAALALAGGGMAPGLRARVLAVQGLVAAGFLAFALFASNPFVVLAPAPQEGLGLNPLLQDPGLAFHPPFLYLGYVGLSIAFSFAVAALIEGRADAAWARWLRPWTLAAWTCLTIGIALGSRWAYYELGWGGWWFWDPVENASFMPWLAATALLHSASVTEKRGALAGWTVLLAILAFSLSLGGTFIVRSGVLTSVHAFAVDPARGVVVLVLLVAASGGALALYAWRVSTLKAGAAFAPVSREGALVLNNLLLAVACFTVLVGTLYPLLLEAVGGRAVSVGPPYYERTFVPLAVPLLLALAAGPLLAWRRAGLAAVALRLRLAAVAALAVWAAAAWWRGPPLALWGPALGLGLAAWIAAAIAIECVHSSGLFRLPAAAVLARARAMGMAAWGMRLAHLGVAVLVAGAVASSAWQSAVHRVMAPGERQQLAGYDIVFEGTHPATGPNWLALAGRFTVRDAASGRLLATMAPEKRVYAGGGEATTEAAIRTTWLADLYIALGEAVAEPPGSWTVRLYHNPLVPWIWAGSFAIALGGLVALVARARRPRRLGVAGGAALAAALALTAPAAASDAQAPGAISSPSSPVETAALPTALEARALALFHQLRCPACPHQSLEQSPAPLAADLRRLVVERLLAGDSDAQALAFIAARYGDFVLLKPPLKAATWPLWAAPFAALALGALALALRIRRGRRGARAGPQALGDAGLDPAPPL